MKLNLVENWLRVLLLSASVRVAAIGALLPEILQLIADNYDAFMWIDDELTSMIRLACLIGVIVFRPIKQESISGK